MLFLPELQKIGNKLTETLTLFPFIISSLESYSVIMTIFFLIFNICPTFIYFSSIFIHFFFSLFQNSYSVSLFGMNLVRPWNIIYLPIHYDVIYKITIRIFKVKPCHSNPLIHKNFNGKIPAK